MNNLTGSWLSTNQVLLQIIAQNAYQTYRSVSSYKTQHQEAVYKFMTTLKPGCMVLENSVARNWESEKIVNSIGRLIWQGELPVHEWDERDDEERDVRPLDTYTIIQTTEGNFFWWFNASFIRIFADGFAEHRLIYQQAIQSEVTCREEQALDIENLDWAKAVLLEHGLPVVLTPSFAQIIFEYAQKQYHAEVQPDWHPWNVLCLFPQKLSINTSKLN